MAQAVGTQQSVTVIDGRITDTGREIYNFNFNMKYHLHEYVPPFSWYLKVEKAKNPVRKLFDKASTLTIFPFRLRYG